MQLVQAGDKNTGGAFSGKFLQSFRSGSSLSREVGVEARGRANLGQIGWVKPATNGPPELANCKNRLAIDACWLALVVSCASPSLPGSLHAIPTTRNGSGSFRLFGHRCLFTS